jgi:uncharacterized protein (DUF2336 family)
MTPMAQALLAELDATLVRAPDQWRGAALRQILDLYLGSAGTYTDDHVTVFDEVLCRLMQGRDRPTLAHLSNKLAPVDNAPAKVLGNLARHLDVAVHGPVLTRAKALPDHDLAAIIDKDRVDVALLTKIAARPQLSEALTEVLIKRGNRAVKRAVIDHPNAHISESGFARLIMNLGNDKEFAAAIATRNDVPAELRLWLDKILHPE